MGFIKLQDDKYGNNRVGISYTKFNDHRKGEVKLPYDGNYNTFLNKVIPNLIKKCKVYKKYTNREGQVDRLYIESSIDEIKLLLSVDNII